MKEFPSPAETELAILEPSAPLRQVYLDVVKGLGFRKISQFGNGRDFMTFLEANEPDWVLTIAEAGNGVNVLQLLRTIIHNPRLKDSKISLFVDEGENEFCLPKAFEMGLFTWHTRSFVKEHVEAQLTDFLTIVEMTGRDPILTSAEYIRMMLNKQKDFQSLENLDRNLVKHFPGNPRVLLALADTQFKVGSASLGLSTVNQACLLDPRLKTRGTQLIRKYGLDPTDINEGGGKVNILSVDRCVIVDNDQETLQIIKELLENLGAEDIVCFDDGLVAWEWMKSNPEPGLVMHEWHLPQLNGLQLVQRIRNSGFIQTPIIVMSSSLDRDDAPLTRELGADGILVKPFTNNNFYKSVVWAIQQSKKPTEQKSFEMKISRLLEKQKNDEAKRLLVQYFRDERIPKLDKMQMEAQFEFANGNIDKAQRLMYECISMGSESVNILNMLGKTLLLQRRYEDAARVFEKVNQMCPHNIKRLLEIANAKIESGDLEGAQEKLEQASEVDIDDNVKQTRFHLEVEKGRIKSASDLIMEIDNRAAIISHMNNRAISLTRNGFFSDGIKLYNKTLAALPKKLDRFRSIVKYNLALAHVRYGDLDKALEILGDPECKKSHLSKKVNSLSKRVRKAHESGSELTLFSIGRESLEKQGDGDSNSDTRGVEDLEKVVMHLEVQKGELCCFQIFFSTAPNDKRCEKWLRKPRNKKSSATKQLYGGRRRAS